jgi:hypothetical protein
MGGIERQGVSTICRRDIMIPATVILVLFMSPTERYDSVWLDSVKVVVVPR